MVDQFRGGGVDVDDRIAIEQQRGFNKSDGVFLGEKLRRDDAELLTLQAGVEDEFFTCELGVERDDCLNGSAGKIDFDRSTLADWHIDTRIDLPRWHWHRW